MAVFRNWMANHGNDSVFFRRAIFVDARRLATADSRVFIGLKDLARVFHVVLIGQGTRDILGEYDIPHATLEPENLLRFARRNALELYASWYIGETPDACFQGILRPEAAGGITAAIRSIVEAENESRVLVGYDRLEKLAVSLKKAGSKIVFTNGVFDLVHIGHLRLLEKARLFGDVLIVGINSDDSTRRIKGTSRPIVPQFARAETLTALRPVDYCCIFTETDPKKVLSIIRPDVLAKGRDYTVKRIVGARFVASYGGAVVRIPLVGGFSTSTTIRRIGGEARGSR